MDRFTSVFSRLAAIFDDVGIDYMVVGSVAASVWGLRRTTVDLDLVVAIAPGLEATLIDAILKDGLYLPVDLARSVVGTFGSFNVIDTKTSGKVDIFVSLFDDTLATLRLSRRIAVELFGVSTWVASPEDIILSKLEWHSSSDSERQWRDCFEVAAVNDLDLEYLRQWATKMGTIDEVERLLASLPD
ncbi:MAG: DUF6036 family nucleotidyltransferase [Acidimicrobiales bacterium]